MSMRTATIAVASLLMTGSVSAQQFECEKSGTGIKIYGTNNLKFAVRCEVKCSYWHPDGSEGYQKCSVQMPPNMARREVCGWNSNDAKTIIGVGHNC